MKTYEKLEDFLEDKSFKQWVLQNDPVEKEYWLEWLSAHPSQAEVVTQAKTILLELDAAEESWDSERQAKLFSKISDRVRFGNENAGGKTFPVYVSYGSAIGKRVKACIAAFLFIAVLTALLQGSLLEKENETLTLEEKQEEWIIKANPKGQKSILQLADGSNVILNAESEIRFERDFGQRHREIYLTGEAFFEVASDSLLPFRVHSGELVTAALGTSFNVNSYEQKMVRVQLATGKVKVYKEAEEEQSVYLIPGEEITMGLDFQLDKRTFDINNAFHWKNGILLFKSMSFQDVVTALERWYAVEITVKNHPSTAMRVSGEFKNTYLKDVLESLGYAYGFEYSINNKEVLIQFKTQN